MEGSIMPWWGTLIIVVLSASLGWIAGVACIPWFGKKVLRRLITQAIEEYTYSR